MSTAFINRPPTPQEFERLRLILSTFQDGTGSLPGLDGKTLPGGFQFEVSLALALGGIVTGKKGKFDVLLTTAQQGSVKFGLSCKMKADLDNIARENRVYIEESNAPAATWIYLNQRGITRQNLKTRSLDAGRCLLERFKETHIAAAQSPQGTINVTSSSLVFLSYNLRGDYQLYWFPLHVVNTSHLIKCEVPQKAVKGGGTADCKMLRGYDTEGILFDWYWDSGGQFKIYPTVAAAKWKSEIFRLEPLPTGENTGLIFKPANYFPKQWAAAISKS